MDLRWVITIPRRKLTIHVSHRFAQLNDWKTGRSLTPLGKALAIPEQLQFLDVALEPRIGLGVHVSCRRTAAEVERIGGQTMSHSTIHRRLQGFAGSHAPFEDLKERPFVWLRVDGTQVRWQRHRGNDLGQAQMR